MDRKKPGVGRLLARLLEEKETNVKEVAQATGVSATTLYSLIQRDSQSANIRDLAAIARHLGVPLEYFSGQEAGPDGPAGEPEEKPDSIDARLLALDSHGREIVEMVLAAETKRMDRVKLGPRFDAAEGGPLAEAEGCLQVSEQQLRDLRENCRLLCVRDDCMAPEYQKGDVLVVHSQSSVEIGQLGIFRLGGKAFFRKLANGALLASNPHYPPILTPPATKLETLGKVVGRIRLPNPASS